MLLLFPLLLFLFLPSLLPLCSLSHESSLPFAPLLAPFSLPPSSSSLQLQRRHEQMKRNLEAQHKELEEKRRLFEDERANWETQQRLEQQKLDASR